MGFQPTFEEPNGFPLHNLNHSAILSTKAVCKFSIDKLHLLRILQITIIKKNFTWSCQDFLLQLLSCVPITQIIPIRARTKSLGCYFPQCHQLFLRKYAVKQLAIQNIALLVVHSSVKFFFLNFQRKWLLKFSRYQFFPRFELGLLNSNCKLLSITPENQ